jgi:hypothetical protein
VAEDQSVGPQVRDVELPRRSIRRTLVLIGALLSVVGLGVELLRHLRGLEHPAVALWSLSYEGNFPSWYASLLPLICAALLAWISAGEDRDRGHWRALALGFLYISIDEAVSLHELLSALFDTEGVLRFGWVIPARRRARAGRRPLVRRLPPPPRPQRPRGASSSRARSTSPAPSVRAAPRLVDRAVRRRLLGYALIDWCEETLEFIGLTLFAAALLAHLPDGALRLTPPGDAPTR